MVRGADGLLLVDTRCNPREADEIVADIEELGRAPIRWVVNTHAHYDHSFGNQHTTCHQDRLGTLRGVPNPSGKGSLVEAGAPD